ncbi:MAG: alanine--tRNA ligase [Polyangiaceae bacterium]|nr:alanine--tRNA ligase [Polyangiaceae bacterium]
MKTTAQIRDHFLEFFQARDHRVVPSASLIPQNDPTLMFNNAGMVPFKDVFTGKEQRDYKRATSSQKCIRISGKHNDLEEVGPSPRHQTFFEMLGNFSFGDYFKEEAIVMAWEFLKELDLPQDRLIFTYFKGEGDVEPDYEARDLWRKVTGFGEERVVGLGAADNFWSMGDTGPCGPCSEIYFFNGDRPDYKNFSDEQTPEGLGWMEIWNLVFMQFERRLVDGNIETTRLPKPSIDTGAGLERLATTVQGVTSNYGVDLLKGLVDITAEISKKKYLGSMANDDVSMRVIADHARTTAFLISEGILPDRTGREYVLRRVMRRAIRHGHRLGIQEPFLHRVTERVVETMGEQYPELRERSELIASITEAEEVRFRQTIERGLGLLDDRFTQMKSEQRTVLSGSDAFQLYDTYGFPVDLTDVICKERGLTVDLKGYDAALEAARKRSEFKGVDQAVESVYRDALASVPDEQVEFTGYKEDSAEGSLLALIAGGKLTDRAAAGDKVELVFAKTPFYAESGGQIGDAGLIDNQEVQVQVTDTQKPVDGLIIHRGVVKEGNIQVGASLHLKVDEARRDKIRRNHSATHLVHWALRQVLGAHAQQKGSLVGPDRLRFDFTHNSALTDGQIAEIERLANHEILKAHGVQTEVLTIEEAKNKGAMMIFEEKYGDVVRMLSMGPSTELCGGLHARSTGEIGLLKIVSEQGVAAGVRRLFATTGEGSLQYVQELENDWTKAADLVKTTPERLLDRLGKMLDRQKSLEKEVETLQKKLMTGGGAGGIDAMLEKAREVNGIKVLGVQTEVSDRAALREMAEQLRDKLGDSVVLVGAADGEKVALVVTVSKALTKQVRAGDLIKVVAAQVGGSGGGRPDMAQAGGTDVAGLPQAIDSIYSAVAG